MDSRITAKLFHAVVVVGMGLASTGCGGDDTPSNTGSGQSNTPTPPPGTTGTTPGAQTPVASNTPSDAGTDADKIAGWACCA